MPDYLKILEQVLSDAASLEAGQPISVAIGPDKVSVGAQSFDVSAVVTVKKA